METRQLYTAGYALGLVGSVATAAGFALGGSPASGALALGVTVPFVLGLRTVRTSEVFDRDHSLSYRLGDWGMAAFVVGLGVLLLAIGVGVLLTFG